MIPGNYGLQAAGYKLQAVAYKLPSALVGIAREGWGGFTNKPWKIDDSLMMA